MNGKENTGTNVPLHVARAGLQNGRRSGAGEVSLQAVRVKARRDIITELGFIKKGKTGYVTRAWIERVIASRCGSCGSTNWFSYA